MMHHLTLRILTQKLNLQVIPVIMQLKSFMMNLPKTESTQD
jgi:hypothetical protein